MNEAFKISILNIKVKEANFYQSKNILDNQTIFLKKLIEEYKDKRKMQLALVNKFVSSIDNGDELFTESYKID